MNIGYILHSSEAGVFVGEFLGLCFWSRWDTAGQEYVPAFDTLEVAEDIARQVQAPGLGTIKAVVVGLSAERGYVELSVAERACAQAASPS